MPARAARRTVLQKVRGRTLLYASTVCKHRVSGSLSLPSRGPFHLSITVLFSIGHWVVFCLGGWSPLLPTRFHVSHGTLDTASLFLPSPTRLSRSMAGFPKSVRVAGVLPFAVLNPTALVLWFGLFPVSLAATSGIDLSFFSSGYLDVSVRRVPLPQLCIGCGISGLSPDRLPHSDTCGSMGICPSPQIFAACHVFLRLPVPRHPPCALFV